MEGFSVSEQLLRRIVKRFRGALVSKAHELLYHSTLGSRVIKKKKKKKKYRGLGLYLGRREGQLGGCAPACRRRAGSCW